MKYGKVDSTSINPDFTRLRNCSSLSTSKNTQISFLLQNEAKSDLLQLSIDDTLLEMRNSATSFANSFLLLYIDKFMPTIPKPLFNESVERLPFSFRNIPTCDGVADTHWANWACDIPIISRRDCIIFAILVSMTFNLCTKLRFFALKTKSRATHAIFRKNSPKRKEFLHISLHIQIFLLHLRTIWQ